MKKTAFITIGLRSRVVIADVPKHLPRLLKERRVILAGKTLSTSKPVGTLKP